MPYFDDPTASDDAGDGGYFNMSLAQLPSSQSDPDWQMLQAMAGAPDVPPIGQPQPGAYDPATLFRMLAATGNPPQPFQGDDPAGGFVGADQYQHGYSSTTPNWHDYTAGANLVCPAEWGCRPEDLAPAFARSSVPGLDDGVVPKSGETYPVRDPVFGMKGGDVRTEISPDGMTITNTTLPGHVFFDGQVVRRLRQAPDGSWYATTVGFGNNAATSDADDNGVLNRINQVAGPQIFNEQDARLLEQMRKRYGR